MLQSGFWHQFALTAHSPIGINPQDYCVTPHYNTISFANNDVDFSDSTGIDHSKFSYGLKKSLFNFMHGIGFELPLQEWFDFEIPDTTIPQQFIEDCLENKQFFNTKPTSKIVWLGHFPLVEKTSKTKKGQTFQHLHLTFHTKTNALSITLNKEHGDWLLEQLEILTPENEKFTTFSQLKKNFENEFEDFELFWYSKPLLKLKEAGLLAI